MTAKPFRTPEEKTVDREARRQRRAEAEERSRTEPGPDLPSDPRCPNFADNER